MRASLPGPSQAGANYVYDTSAKLRKSLAGEDTWPSHERPGFEPRWRMILGAWPAYHWLSIAPHEGLLRFLEASGFGLDWLDAGPRVQNGAKPRRASHPAAMLNVEGVRCWSRWTEEFGRYKAEVAKDKAEEPIALRWDSAGLLLTVRGPPRRHRQTTPRGPPPPSTHPAQGLAPLSDRVPKYATPDGRAQQLRSR